MSSPLSWSELYEARRAAARRFGSIYQLPLVRRASRVVLAALVNGDRVLEVGAGDRRFASRIAQGWPACHYESLDPDPRSQHDHATLRSPTGPYQLVFALEVIEHLPIESIPGWLARLAELQPLGGRLVISTPNTFYPPAYLRDATHRTPLCYDELAGLVSLAGYRVEGLWRVHHDPLPSAWVRRYLFGWLFRLVGLDYARQIVLLAVRKD